MEVPALDVVVPRPHARFCVREHDVDRLLLGLFVLPNVEVVERRFAVARRAKPRCSSDVVDDQLGDAQAAVLAVRMKSTKSPSVPSRGSIA